MGTRPVWHVEVGDRLPGRLRGEEPDLPAGEVASVLDAADLIVTAAGPEIVAEIERERSTRPWWKVWKRKDTGKINMSER